MIFKVQRILEVLVIAFFITSCLSDSDEMGPADIIIERFEDCENANQFDVKLPFSVQKLNRSHNGYTGCFNMAADLDQQVALNLTAAKWGDGGWKPNAINFADSCACNVFNKYVSTPWLQFMGAAGRSSADCPIPKDSYCIDKATLALENLFPNMMYGSFRVDTLLQYQGVARSCIRMYVKSVASKKE